MPLVVDVPDDHPVPEDPEKIALRARVKQLEAFVALIQAEYDEPGAITKAEIKRDLDTLR